MKCGKEIPEKQVFCDSCLAVMERFPVKPDTRVLLPNRPAPVLSKKSPARKKALSPEERLAKAKKAIQWLSILLAATLFALFLSVTLLVDSMNTDQPDQAIGQNYNTADTAKDSH